MRTLNVFETHMPSTVTSSWAVVPQADLQLSVQTVGGFLTCYTMYLLLTISA